jgi:succinate dehydrogenase / fumarate reductase cytochrome b subunit
VLDTALIRIDPAGYDAVMATYNTWYICLGEPGLVAAILFHALNGVRIILIDFWRKGAKFQNVMFWVVIGLAVLLFAGFAPRHLINVFSHI